MKINDSRRSSNVEDRRGMADSGPSFRSNGSAMGCSPALLIGLFQLFARGRNGRISLPRVLILLLLLFFLSGGLNQLGGLGGLLPDSESGQAGQIEIQADRNSGSAGAEAPKAIPTLRPDGEGGSNTQASDEQIKDYLQVVLAQTEDCYSRLFAAKGLKYRSTTLVLYEGAVQSGCGYNSAQVGPFYCPADAKVYIDMSFFRELATRYGADGDFVMGYVLAHEIGHHVQNLLGISEQVQRLRQQSSETEANRLSVRLELQADYFAGVWAHHVDREHRLENGDLEEAVTAAQAIGDDTLQKRAQGYVIPDSFTHGKASQRMKWFKKGFEAGDLDSGDTYNLNYNELRLPQLTALAA